MSKNHKFEERSQHNDGSSLQVLYREHKYQIHTFKILIFPKRYKQF